MLTTHDQPGTGELPPVPAAEPDEERGPLRTCLATGVASPREGLMRFVVGPGDGVVPDVAGKLPGRGLWVTATAEALRVVMARKGFARGARRAVTVDPGLPETVERQLRERALGSLAMARRGGHAVAGFAKVEERLRAGKLGLVIVAVDGAEADGRAKLDRATAPLAMLGDSTELGRIFGRDAAVYVGVARPVAAAVIATIDRWRAFRGEAPLAPRARTVDA